MIHFIAFTKEWERLRTLRPEEFDLLDKTIEDGVYDAFGNLENDFCEDLVEAYPEVRDLPFDGMGMIQESFYHALYYGYLVYVAYQKFANIERPKNCVGIELIPDLVDEYLYICNPEKPNEESENFYRLFDEEPAIDLLIEKITKDGIETLRINYPPIDDAPCKIGFMIKELIYKGVYNGFCFGYVENSLRASRDF